MLSISLTSGDVAFQSDHIVLGKFPTLGSSVLLAEKVVVKFRTVLVVSSWSMDAGVGQPFKCLFFPFSLE